MPVVEEYWAGVVQRLQAEVDVFARLIKHHATQGQENEAALARLLQSFVPGRIGVGTGMIIDHLDNYARQTDIVLYEQSDEPAILAQTTQLLHPIETVRAGIEVKTRLRSEDIDDCLVKRKALNQLKPAINNPDGSSHPLFVVLAYDAQLSPQAVHSRFSSAAEAEQPDLYCILEPGLIGGRYGVLRGNDARFASGLTLLRNRGDGGRRSGPYEQAPEGYPDDTVLIEGRPFPIVRLGTARYLGEPPRALLLFVEALARKLAEQQRRGVPVLSHYLDDIASELKWL